MIRAVSATSSSSSTRSVKASRWRAGSARSAVLMRSHASRLSCRRAGSGASSAQSIVAPSRSVLPGSSPATKVGFLMYPNGETADGRLDSLDPQTFSYRIASKPVTA